jgi:hypothetical protein
VSGRRDAPARHPSAQWRPDLDRMTKRVTEYLAATGHPWPDIAAVFLGERGRLGLDRCAYATRVGLDLELLAAIEDGDAVP